VRAGSTAFASRPIENAEKRRPNGGGLSGSASWTTVRHASDRATTESRLSRIATAIQLHSTRRNAFATSPHSGPRQYSITIATPRSASTMATRTLVLAGPGSRARSHAGLTCHEVVDTSEPSRDAVPRVLALGELACGSAHRVARGSSSSTPMSACVSDDGSPGGIVTLVSLVVTSR
jgi:hypothetical protein